MGIQYTTLPHCKILHPVHTHWLPPEQNHYKVHVLMTSECRMCKKPLYGWFGILPNASRGPVHILKDREIKPWLLRLKDVRTGNPEHTGPVVSDYTWLIATDTAVVYQEVLQRA